MNKISIIIFILLNILFTSCKKKYHFDTSEITETDLNGNITGNINYNDWKIKKLSEASNFDKNVFQQFQTSQDQGSSGFKLTDYKSDCDIPTNFGLIAYPNPMINSECWLNFNLQTELEFNYGIEIYTDKYGKVFQVSGFSNNISWRSKINALTVRDFIYYGIFITADSCIYYTKGNVIGCSL